MQKIFSGSITAVLLLLALLVAACVPTAEAWRDRGHMTVAEIARRYIQSDTRGKIEACGRILGESGPYPKVSNAVEAATWPDSLRTMGLQTMFNWHFINTPVNPDDIKLTFNPITTVNVQSVLPDLETAISRNTAVTGTIVQSVANLLHFAGDCHQPLHGSTLFHEQLPDGDQGGNLINAIVDDKGTTMVLHRFWDCLGEGPCDDAPLPLSDADRDAVNAFADHILQTNTFTDAEVNLDIKKWAEESYNVAVADVYTPDVIAASKSGTPVTLTAAYKTKAQEIAQRRIGLAGRRLAVVLDRALKNVKLDTIEAGEQAVQTRVEAEEPPKPIVVEESTGMRDGEVAAIVLVCFVIGCLVGLAMTAIFWVYRRPSYHHAATDDQDPKHTGV